MGSVTLRKKILKKGRVSLYLDFWPKIVNPDTGKLSRYQFLDIYLYKRPKNDTERFHNEETIALAQHIQARRILDIQAMKYDFISERMMKGNFVDFFETEKNKASKSDSDNWDMALRYFKDFTGTYIPFPQVNETFAEEYADYLLSAPALGNRNRPISQNTAVSYFAKFRATLRQAFKKRLLSTNIYELVDSISPKETHREFLTLEELQRLADTPCTSQVVYRASIFSALTGLRFSDIHTMRWDEIRGSRGNYSVQFSIDKTDAADYLPIPDQAFDLLGSIPDMDSLVFSGLSYSKVRSVLPGWLAEAGIKKKFSFHCFRHTYATLQLLFGTDIVTLSKMLGHKDIKTTMIYVKIVDSLKRAASTKIRLAENKEWLQLQKSA